MIIILVMECFAYVFQSCQVKGKTIKHPTKAQQLQQAALVFLVGGGEFAIDKLPLEDALLKLARFVDVQMGAIGTCKAHHILMICLGFKR